MRSNRRRNWLIKRMALGLAIAAIAAPVAQAKVDEGSSLQANGYQAFTTDFPVSSQVNASSLQANGYQAFTTDFPVSPQVNASDYGMPRALPADYALANRDQIEVVRAEPKASSSDKIEFVRTQPRSIGGPQVVAAGFDWNDAATGAGIALGLVLLGWGAVLATRHMGRPQTA
jgi:hypothetical protein